MVPIQHDGVVAALHVFYGCIEAVAIGRVGTSGACVGTVEPQAVGPAVVHGESIIGGDGGGWYWWAGRFRQHWWFSGGACDSSSGVENIGAGREFVEVFFVFGGEVRD